MTYYLEVTMRAVAADRLARGLPGWDGDLRASGLDPARWSDGTIDKRFAAEPAREAQRSRAAPPSLPPFDPSNADAWTDEPPARTSPATTVVRFDPVDVAGMTRDQVRALPNFRHRAGPTPHDRARKEPK